MKDKIKEFSLSNLKWIERLDLTNDPAPVIDGSLPDGDDHGDGQDDFNREMRL